MKPRNVLFSLSNQLEEAKFAVSDFGISVRAEVGRLTRVPAKRGTYPFMAPEAAGRHASINGYAVGPSSDIWSLGAMVLEQVFGWWPGDGFVSHLAGARQDQFGVNLSTNEWADIRYDVSFVVARSVPV